MTLKNQPSTLVVVYLALLLLLALTAFAGALPHGPWSTPLALTIALAKTALIFLFFMQLHWHPGLLRAFALAGFFWLAIAFTLIFADYATRAWKR